MHHRPSRCWTWPTVSAATSDRRSPQPRSTARIARSRSPLVVVTSGVFSSVCACFTESQFPKRMPLDATPFTRVIPLASSGASSPLSAASTASLRTAVIRTLMETAPSPRASSATRQAADGRLGEAGPGFAPVPLEELVEPEIVNAAGDRRGDAIQHQALQSLPMGSLRNNNQISHLGPLNGQYR